MSNDNSSISYIKILDTDTRSIEMHRIKCYLVESRNKSKLIISWLKLPQFLITFAATSVGHIMLTLAKFCKNMVPFVRGKTSKKA